MATELGHRQGGLELLADALDDVVEFGQHDLGVRGLDAQALGDELAVCCDGEVQQGHRLDFCHGLVNVPAPDVFNALRVWLVSSGQKVDFRILGSLWLRHDSW